MYVHFHGLSSFSSDFFLELLSAVYFWNKIFLNGCSVQLCCRKLDAVILVMFFVAFLHGI